MKRHVLTFVAVMMLFIGRTYAQESNSLKIEGDKIKIEVIAPASRIEVKADKVAYHPKENRLVATGSVSVVIKGGEQTILKLEGETISIITPSGSQAIAYNANGTQKKGTEEIMLSGGVKLTILAPKSSD